MLEDAARGRFPAADGSVEVESPPPGLPMAVVGFSGHAIIASSASEEWVRSQLADDDVAAPMSPRFLAALGQQLGRVDDGVDVVLAASGLSGQPDLHEVPGSTHPRATRARRHRSDVRVFEDTSGTAIVILGRGLAMRTEVAMEIETAHRGVGLARRALVEARSLVGPEDLLFAQVAPANAAALRALLAAGFRPIGSEALFLEP